MTQYDAYFSLTTSFHLCNLVFQPVQPGVRTIMFPPTYRDLQYADSLEGTDASLMKYRRKTTYTQVKKISYWHLTIMAFSKD